MKRKGFLKAGQRSLGVVALLSWSFWGCFPFALATVPLRLEISLSRRQLTLYQGHTPLRRYPVAVGRPGWETPIGQFQVRQLTSSPR